MLQHHNMIQNRCHNFRVNPVCKIQFLPECFFQRFGIYLRSFLDLLLLLQGRLLFLQGGDLAVESVITHLEL